MKAILFSIVFFAFAIPGFTQTALTLEEQSRLAERFAPVLVYHPAEKYFPSSPLFPLEENAANAGESAVSVLGTAASRGDSYLALTLEKKAELATVYYRAYPSKRDSKQVIVIEYWLYYVQDVYRVRGGVIPLWFDGSHPNDLEHIRIVLRADADSSLTVDGVYASSHEGTIPSNRFLASGRDLPDKAQVLVELGSHANAPDMNRDGLFIPGVDGDSGNKMLWGIRDKGVIWTRFNPSYMALRSQNSVVLSHEKSDGLPGKHFSYRLIPADELARDFARLKLTDRQRKDIFEIPVHWFRRALGTSNGSSGKLLTPPSVKKTSRVENYSSTERGLLVGGTYLTPEPGALLGGRWSFLNGKSYLPDLMFEADGIVTVKGKSYLSTHAMLTYPIDGMLRLMGGAGLVTDSIRFDRRQWDWIAAGEVRLGRIRVYGASRTWGAITRSAVDFRMSYLF